MVALDPRPFRCGVGEDVKFFFFFFFCGWGVEQFLETIQTGKANTVQLKSTNYSPFYCSAS